MAATRVKFVVQSGSGPLFDLAGQGHTTFKVLGDQTSGAFSIVESVMNPGMFIPPHFHERTDEVSYVLEGELGAMVAEEEFQVRAGSFVVRPKGIRHALWNVTDRLVRVLEMFAPAGFEAGFEEQAILVASGQQPTFEERLEFARRHDTFLVPELAPALMRKYRLEMPK